MQHFYATPLSPSICEDAYKFTKNIQIYYNYFFQFFFYRINIFYHFILFFLKLRGVSKLRGFLFPNTFLKAFGRIIIYFGD